jgi:hypothetical protein
MMPINDVMPLAFVGDAMTIPGGVLATVPHIPALTPAIAPILFVILGFIALVLATSNRTVSAGAAGTIEATIDATEVKRAA